MRAGEADALAGGRDQRRLARQVVLLMRVLCPRRSSSGRRSHARAVSVIERPGSGPMRDSAPCAIPARAARVAVVRIAAQLAEELVVCGAACRGRARRRGPVPSGTGSRRSRSASGRRRSRRRSGGDSARRRHSPGSAATAPRCSIVASWMPSSPELCTATPSPIVSQTPAALMHGRMPPQNVVSSRITSTRAHARRSRRAARS